MPSFNLVTERWIPCIMEDGRSDELGLQDVLVRAHEIREIFDSSPLVTISLHRLLLAILHRNFGPANLPEWKTLWNRGRWDEAKLSNYFNKWHHRFDLFDEKRPFYQTPELEGAEKHPVLRLAMEVSSGNNATLFDHSNDRQPDAVTPAMAARYVIATQAFAIGFGKSQPFYFSDSPLIRGMTVLALGNTLFETLALNLIIYNEQRPFPCTGEDVPIWERDELPQPDKNCSLILGYLDYLTWQSRSIHLFPEGSPTSVRYCQIQQNLKLPKQQYPDPFKCFEKSKERGYVPLNISQDKALWRDSQVLFQTANQTYERPEVFNFLARIEMERHEKGIVAQAAYRLAIAGLATKASKAANVILWRHERLPLPLKYLEDENLVRRLKQALDLAERVGWLFEGGFFDKKEQHPRPLQILASALLPLDRTGKPDRKEVSNLVKHLSPGRPYWAQLGISFDQLLTELAGDRVEADGEVTYGVKTLPWWTEEVEKAAWKAFQDTTRSLDRSARMLKAVTQAERTFGWRLARILKPQLKNKQRR